MTRTLDIVALRSLLAIDEHGGFHRAAQALSLSQSAVSQHVRRLEAVVGRRLLERHGRGARFTADGEALAIDARAIIAAHDEALQRFGVTEIPTIVVGATEHAADQLLPLIQLAIAADQPRAAIRFRLDRSAALREALDQSVIDVAILIGSDHGAPAGELPLSWYAAAGWQPGAATEALPLVVIDEPCTIRRKALRTLAANDRRAAIVGEAGHLAGVLNATRAGLGVALLADTGPAPEGLRKLSDLPPVAPEPLTVHARRGAPAALGAGVRSAVEAFLAA